MKNIYFVQPSNKIFRSVYLPYAAGTLAAYAWQFAEIKQNYELKRFIFMKEEIAGLIETMESPFLTAFSCYLWNIEYNLELAAAVKRKWPDCTVVFGGPQMPEDGSYMEKHGFIDVQICGEGEVPFYNLLTALLNGRDLSEVGNLIYRENGALRRTEKRPACDVCDFPSPYSSGFFDAIVDDPKNSDIQFDAVIETNRGCPYHCAYCTWGKNSASIRQFSMDRVKKDFDWFAKKKIQVLFSADANFGLFPRDEEIVDYMISLKRRYGYPEKFLASAAKNREDFVFKLYKKMEAADLHKGVSIPCQSMSPEVLNLIGRKNNSVEILSKQIKRYRDAGIHSYIELILALPGESCRSFCKGLFDVIEAGAHDIINVYPCELLANSPMAAPEFIEKYQLKTVKAHVCQTREKVGNDSLSDMSSEIVISTSTMTTEDWLRAYRVAVFTQTLHCLGLTRYIAVYLRKANLCSYYDFYMQLFDSTKKRNGCIRRILMYTTASFDRFVQGKDMLHFEDFRFSDFYWYFDEGMFLVCTQEIEDFYAELTDYVHSRFGDGELINDLLLYQKASVTLPKKQSETHLFQYDWLAYFDALYDPDVTVPAKAPIQFTFRQETYESLWDYARRVVWLGRRHHKTIINDIERIELNP